MKKETEINFAKISNEQAEALVTVVKETIAMDFTAYKTFTTADLWNIQRRSNTTSNRRHLA